MRKLSPKYLLCAGILAIAVMGTGLISYADTETTTEETEMEGRRGRHDDGSVMAKIVSVDDDEISVLMAAQPEKPEDGTAPADGETPPEKPEDGETPLEKPADGETPPEKPADGETPPEKPADGETPPETLAEGESLPERPEGEARKMREMSFSDETTTLTLGSDVVITKGMEQEEVSASSLTADTVVRMVLDGTTVTRIEIME